jgi:hypothetical protein
MNFNTEKKRKKIPSPRGIERRYNMIKSIDQVYAAK